MFIAMNRFRIVKGQEDAFETVWRNRETRLAEMDGFRSFNLLKGPEKTGEKTGESEDYVLYASHTIWDSRADFEAWTRSEQFRAAHKGAGQTKGLYLGHPEFEGFEAVSGLAEVATADESAAS
ncbi:MAG: antibiotic biosynthesis monooxygenase [Pseudomonadota bacterium]